MVTEVRVAVDPRMERDKETVPRGVEEPMLLERTGLNLAALTSERRDPREGRCEGMSSSTG